MTSAIAQLSRIEALAYCFDNADAHDMEAAAANLANNCPAFWHRAAGGNAAVTGFMFFLNRTQDVVRAWELYEHEFQRPSKMRDADLLDELLPLNRAAAVSLERAYDEIEPRTFRTASELLSRTCDAEEKARAAVDAFRRHGTEHPLIKAMGGIDWRRVERAGRAANREAPSAPVVTGAANLAEAVA